MAKQSGEIISSCPCKKTIFNLILGDYKPKKTNKTFDKVNQMKNLDRFLERDLDLDRDESLYEDEDDLLDFFPRPPDFFPLEPDLKQEWKISNKDMFF